MGLQTTREKFSYRWKQTDTCLYIIHGICDGFVTWSLKSLGFEFIRLGSYIPYLLYSMQIQSIYRFVWLNALIGVAQARETWVVKPAVSWYSPTEEKAKIHWSSRNEVTCSFDRCAERFDSRLLVSLRRRWTTPSLFNAKVICSLALRFSCSWTHFRRLVLEMSKSYGT